MSKEDKPKRAITKLLDGNSSIVATFDPDIMWQSKFTLFIGTQATNFGGSGVVNDNPPVQVSLTVDELSDLKDFIEDALKLNEEGAQPPA